MAIEFDWAILEKIGIAGVCAVFVYFGFQALSLILVQWSNSTDAVNKNTEAFQELSKVFEKSFEREIVFQEEMRERMKDTQEKVTDIHRKIV